MARMRCFEQNQKGNFGNTFTKSFTAMLAGIADGVVAGVAALFFSALLILCSLGVLFPSLERGMLIWNLLCIVVSVPLALITGLASGHFAHKRFTSPNQPSWIPIVIIIVLLVCTLAVSFAYHYIFTADDVGSYVAPYFTLSLIGICSPVILIANFINAFRVLPK